MILLRRGRRNDKHAHGHFLLERNSILSMFSLYLSFNTFENKTSLY
jgi:hypothetical protein